MGTFATEHAGFCFRQPLRNRALPYEFNLRAPRIAEHQAMKIQDFQSAFAMVGEASLIGTAAESFSRISVGNAMDEKRRSQQPSSGMAHRNLPLPAEIRRLLSAACAAKGGPERMTLNDWREAEQKIKRKLRRIQL